jgi:hypothetical protein
MPSPIRTGRVGHRAHDRALGSQPASWIEADAGGDADHQLARQHLADLGVAQQRPDLVRLDADEHDVAGAARLAVVAGGADAVLLAQRLHHLGAAIGREDLGRLQLPGTQDSPDDGFTHRPAPEHGQRLILGEHGAA